jgi:glycosyltransferase involved in cell wall biosynthesis
LGELISNADFKIRFATWLQFPWLIRERINRWNEGLGIVDHFVAVCQWVYDLLIKNNIPPEKIHLCRQGVGQIPLGIEKQKNNTLRLGYLGRMIPEKGVGILLKAFRLLPFSFRTELYIYGTFQNKAEREFQNKLVRQSSKDKRIKWLGFLSDGQRFQALSNIDILVIPSNWLETGPLVLLESWAVGTPVIGAKLGGISELVTDGFGGLLFAPKNAKDLAGVIMRVCEEPHLLKELAASIPNVRTMQEVAYDMQSLYQKLQK